MRRGSIESSPLLEEEARLLQEQREETFGRKDEVPVKSIVLGAVLLILGLAFYFVCYLHHRGHTTEHIKEGSGWGLLTLGTLTFLPGAYATWTAFAAWQGLLGYSYSDIPKVD